MLHEGFFVQHRLCNLHFAWLCLIDKCVLFILILCSLNMYLYTICSALNPCLHYNFTLIFNLCIPNFGVIKYSYIQAIVVVLVNFLPKNPWAEFLWFRCDIFLFFQILLLHWLLVPIVTWCVLNFSIKYSDLPVRFAAFAGMLTSPLSMAAKSGCGNIFSAMHPITK